jgi:hypothetical protein
MRDQLKASSDAAEGALGPPGRAALPPPTIPGDADELTPEWVTTALRARGVLKSARVTELRKEILGEGEGFIGQIVRLHLRLDRPEAKAPATLIAKLPIGLAQNRALGEMLGAYEREIRFYEELASDVALRSPRCYFSAMDPHLLAGREERALRLFQRIPTWVLRLLLPLLLWLSGRSKRRYVLLLEDLAPARVGDQTAGCTPAEAERILRELAAAQAGLWNSARFEPLFWLARTNLVPRVSHLMFRRNRHIFFEELGSRAPDALPRIAEWLDANGIALMNHLASPPLALSHGDYRLDNLLFGSSVDGPTLAAVDWQGAGCGRPPLDVGYFLMTNLNVNLAAESELRLVGSYHEELLARGVGGYPFEECWRDYELSKLFLVYRMLMGGNLLDLSHERGQILIDRILARLLALLPTGDLDALLGSDSTRP